MRVQLEREVVVFREYQARILVRQLLQALADRIDLMLTNPTTFRECLAQERYSSEGRSGSRGKTRSQTGLFCTTPPCKEAPSSNRREELSC